jgi:hypothetical protein
MGAAAFGRLVDQAMRDKGWGQGRVAVAIGVLPDGKVWDATRVGRLRAGKVRHLDRELVGRLVDVLDLDPAEAWEAAGLWPPDLKADDYRDFVTVGGIGAKTPSTTGSNPTPFHNPQRLRLAA